MKSVPITLFSFASEFHSDSIAKNSLLLLNPIAGALAGWVGILVINWMSAINILSKEFAGIKWPTSSGYIQQYSLAAAFVFGFSERMLMNIIKPIEEKVALKQKDD